jgi:hypothetical protein
MTGRKNGKWNEVGEFSAVLIRKSLRGLYLLLGGCFPVVFDCMSGMQVEFWINKVHLERTDLSIIASPGREFDEGLAAVLAEKFDADPHLLGDLDFNGLLVLD